MKELFIKTDKQRAGLKKLHSVQDIIMQEARFNDEHAAFPYKSIQALREIGYPQLTLPVRYGGEGFSLYDAILMQETLASYDGSTSLIMCWTLQNTGNIFNEAQWSEEQLQPLATAIKNGAMLNKAVSEFAMGSPTRGGKPLTTAQKLADGWLLNGRKNYMTGSYALDYFITLAWIEEQQTTGYFLIPKDVAGVGIEETWDVAAMRSTGSHDLILENVKLPINALVEMPNANAGNTLFNSWSLLIPATYLGIAQAASNYAVQFAKQHSPNSIVGTISEIPHIQTAIGEMQLALMNARLAIYGAADLAMAVNNNEIAIIHAMNSAKHIVVNEAIQIVDQAMRIVGAKSLQRDNPLQRYYRDVRAGLHNPPMDDMTISKLAQHVLQ